MPTQYGLIGKTLKHSFSKKYFSEKFSRENIDANYELYELADISEFPALIQRIPDLKGLNVTIPYKQEVIPYLDELSPEAKAIGAVNTILISPKKKLSGHNSDIYGFWYSLEAWLDGTEIPKALILGTGGAAKAVAYVMEHFLKVEEYKLVSRKEGADRFTYEDLFEIDMSDYPLIINTTPLGTYPAVEGRPHIPYAHLTEKHFAYDLVYNPENTAFMQACARYGATTKSGIDMLIGQAEKSWEIWNEV